MLLSTYFIEFVKFSRTFIYMVSVAAHYSDGALC